MSNAINVFIGFDASEPAAYFVAKESIEQNFDSSMYGLTIRPICQQLLRMRGIYNRPPDPLASTEFTYTRFLVPWLMGFHGWALFMDSDMFFRANIADLWTEIEHDKALMCVQHDHVPRNAAKMVVDGKAAIQTQYRRKNWSSFVLWNCGHEANRVLKPGAINNQTPAALHQFLHVVDEDIGRLPLKWNWLEGWNDLEQCPQPSNVHYTDGIPGIHDGKRDAAFADEYMVMAERAIMDTAQ